MNISKICTVFFSPTGGTKKAADALSNDLSGLLNVPTEAIDLTVPGNRQETYSFSADSLVILATPVYAGRIPNKLFPDLQKCVHGAGNTPVIPVCVYGNRNYDEALRELLLLTEENGFIPVAAAALISQHAFSKVLAKGRPDASDLKKLSDFAGDIAKKLKSGEAAAIDYDRQTPIAPYYTPLKTDHTPARFLKAKPLTDEQKCDNCGICVQKCPMGSIDVSDVKNVSGVCIKCQACIKGCPKQAKYFTDEDFLSHVQMLEATYMERKEPVFFL